MEKDRDSMLAALTTMTDEKLPYHQRLEAYEFLLEDCGEILDDMLAKFYASDGETAKMLLEVMAQYKGNKAVFMALVGWLYRGDDVALMAKLIGEYGDEQGISVLKTFCDEYEPGYNEYMELRNAVEELGGDFDLEQDFSDDPLYRYLKGLDEEDEDSRRSPFEDMFKSMQDREDDDLEDDDDCCHDDCCDCRHDDEHEGQAHNHHHDHDD